MTCDFQQCDILTSVDSDEPVQPLFKPRNSKWCSVSSLTLIEYSWDYQRLWSDCAYAQADLRFCWSHIPHCWKSHVAAHYVMGTVHNLQLTDFLWPHTFVTIFYHFSTVPLISYYNFWVTLCQKHFKKIAKELWIWHTAKIVDLAHKGLRALRGYFAPSPHMRPKNENCFSHISSY